MSSSSSPSDSASALRKRASSSTGPANKKHAQKVEPAAVGSLSLRSVEAVLDVFDKHPYMISETYVAELRAMSAAWARVGERCELFERAGAEARAKLGEQQSALLAFKGPQPGVVCHGHFYLGGSDALDGTPLSLDIWELILARLAGRDRVAFSRASKTCLSLQRGLVTRLFFGHPSPSGAKALAAARDRTVERRGRQVFEELEQLMSTPRCRELVVGRPVSGAFAPAQLPDWYYFEVVTKALMRCPEKVAVRFTHVNGYSQTRFLSGLYYAYAPQPLLAATKVSCIVVRSASDLCHVLKAMCEGRAGGVAPDASAWPPILFEAKPELACYGPGDRWGGLNLSKTRWSFDTFTTKRMTNFRGIFVSSVEDFEACLPPAFTGTKPAIHADSSSLSPLFSVMFPIYVDSTASVDTDPEKWSRAKRYQPAYFKKDEAEGLLEHMIRVNKKLTF